MIDRPDRDRAIAVIGGTGFIGRHLLAALRRDGRHARVLVRGDATTVAQTYGWQPDDVTPVSGDLDDSAALARLLTPGCSVVNLAWSGVAAPDAAARQARHLAAACRAANVRILLQGSTAAVFGGCDAEARIDDRTPPRPADDYGRAKLAIDELLRQELDGRVPLTIVRPTSVFGRGGLGLVKLSEALARGAGLANYARSCLFDRRLLHLVPVETVVQAILFLEARASDDAGTAARTRCFLVSADNEPLNRFRAMEQRLMSLWQVDDYRWPRLPLPPAWLRLALRASGRSHSLAFTVIDGTDIRALGFEPPVTVDSAVAAFAAWFPSRDRARAAFDLP